MVCAGGLECVGVRHEALVRCNYLLKTCCTRAYKMIFVSSSASVCCSVCSFQAPHPSFLRQRRRGVVVPRSAYRSLARSLPRRGSAARRSRGVHPTCRRLAVRAGALAARGAQPGHGGGAHAATRHVAGLSAVLALASGQHALTRCSR